MMRHATVLMSGGIDSAACAHLLAGQGNTINAVFIDYGQAAAATERRAVREITTQMGANLSCYSVLGSESFTAGELVGRNAFLVVTALFLTRARPGMLAMGIHGGTPYWDCSEGFAREMGRLVAEHTDGNVVFVAPFLAWSKSEVYEAAIPENAL